MPTLIRGRGGADFYRIGYKILERLFKPVLKEYICKKCFEGMACRAETRQCAPPPRNHLSESPKNFSRMVMQKSEPRKGNATLGGSGGLPPEIFAEFDRILEVFCAF